jgi:integrase
MLVEPAHWTEAGIASLMKRSGSDPRELTDPTLPDLRLRIGSGVAHWTMVGGATGGVRLRMTLGAWPALGLSDARNAVFKLKGGDGRPSDQRGSTVSLLLERYKMRRLAQLKTGEGVSKALDHTLRDILQRHPSTVTRRELAEIIDIASDSAPVRANRCLAYTKAFFTWCVGRGYIDTSPATGITKPTLERARERTPSLPELVEIWEAADEMGYPFGTAIQILILTAARREEVCQMEWAEISDVGGVAPCWSLPSYRSKNGRALRSPLAALTANLLHKAKGAQAPPSRYVFTTGRVERPISGWSKAKIRIDRIIGERRLARSTSAPDFPPWRIHDLRRSFATLACDELQIDPAIADRCLNHVGASTTSTISRVYGRSEMFEQRRDALQRWSELIAKAVETECHTSSGNLQP